MTANFRSSLIRRSSSAQIDSWDVIIGLTGRFSISFSFGRGPDYALPKSSHSNGATWTRVRSISAAPSWRTKSKDQRRRQVIALSCYCLTPETPSRRNGNTHTLKATGSFTIPRQILAGEAIRHSASSATGLFVKSESDRFFEENRHKFTALSLEMDDAITNFYLEFRRADYNDASMELPPTRAEFLELLAGTLRRLGDLRKEYNDNYRLNTNL